MKNTKKSGSRLYRTVYPILAWFVGILFNIRVIGGENEPERSGFMVCANHTSATDPICLCYAFNRHQVRFMAKKELFKVPIVNICVKLLGAFPIDRSGGDVGAIKKSVALLKSGESMGIFPQGHRYPAVNPRDTEPKNGAALICTKAEADIVPVYISRKGNKSRLFRRTYVIIGEPIPYSSLEFNREASGEYNRITNIIFDRICTIGEEFEANKSNKA